MARQATRHERDAGGPADVPARKGGLAAGGVGRDVRGEGSPVPGAAGRIPTFTGAEAAAGRLGATPMWPAAGTVTADPDSAQLPVRQRAVEDGKTVYMAGPRLAGQEPCLP
jgi:5-formyltetrahydrofolate cyclo-ligase